MALPIPPQPPFPAADPARYPLAGDDFGGSDWIDTVQDITWDILGRDGQQASAANRAVVEATLNESPLTAALGSWTNMRWWAYIGTGDGRWQGTPYITFEFRTPGEVSNAAGGGHDFVPFAMTVTDQDITVSPPPNLPPIDGGSAYGIDYSAPGWDGVPFVRILIREDAIAQSGEAFLAESVQHELGHVVTSRLIAMYGEDYVKEQTCALFGRSTSSWNHPDDAWGNRVLEAACETYKDIMLPGRRYNNRTHLRLPQASFDDFKKLYVDFAENPYWEASNVSSPFYSPDPLSGVVNWFVLGGFHPYWTFLGDDAAADWTGSLDNLLALPRNGVFRQHWNFDTTVYNPGSQDWSDYDPATEAKVKLGMNFYALPFFPGPPSDAPVDSTMTEINSAGSVDGHLPVAFPSLPTDGYAMRILFAGGPPWEYPRPETPGVPDFAVLPSPMIHPTPPPYTRPWVSVLAERARPPIRALPWPYTVAGLGTSGSAHVSTVSGHGRLEVPWRVRGRKLRISSSGK